MKQSLLLKRLLVLLFFLVPISTIALIKVQGCYRLLSLELPATTAIYHHQTIVLELASGQSKVPSKLLFATSKEAAGSGAFHPLLEFFNTAPSYPPRTETSMGTVHDFPLVFNTSLSHPLKVETNMGTVHDSPLVFNTSLSHPLKVETSMGTVHDFPLIFNTSLSHPLKVETGMGTVHDFSLIFSISPSHPADGKTSQGMVRFYSQSFYKTLCRRTDQKRVTAFILFAGKLFFLQQVERRLTSVDLKDGKTVVFQKCSNTPGIEPYFRIGMHLYYYTKNDQLYRINDKGSEELINPS